MVAAMAERNGSTARSNGHSSNGHETTFSIRHRGNGAGGPDLPIDWERLARATAHPVRIAILEVLGMDGGRTLSPSDIGLELQIPLSNTNYHVIELAKAGLIHLAHMRPVRGATEHFYRIPDPAPAAVPTRTEKRNADLEPATA
jgi:DNA-binding transcriptional ArsR family regulator